MSHEEMSPERLRERILRMFARNAFSGTMPLRLVEAGVGRAVVAMEVGPQQMNGHGTCHGGALWTLADMAFGAAGYYDGTILTMGSDLTFIRPAPGGATVHGAAAQISRRGLSGLFTVELTLEPGNPDAVVAAGTFSGRWLRGQGHDGRT
ncbi:PaaI family thioesterase [Xanthobacter sp. AM11]|uniref:PaaI family thioesterase n=1 Tax=Xanthobacter sp. AM11 TaxID=3380643 RepID=UPI0039BED6A4